MDASVINKGTLSTDSVGSVFLLAPYVENDGVIQTQFGQVGLAAAKAVDIYQNVSVRDWLIVDVTGQVYGDAVNGNNGHAVNNGQITANNGLIGMYGTGVDQNGVVSVETSLSSQSHDEIELMASNEVSTGAGSITSTPISASSAKELQTADFESGKIRIFGLDPGNLNGATAQSGPQQVVINGLIQAPSGNVSIYAQDNVTLGNKGGIDVSGVWIKEPASANTTQVQLNSVELRDYPDQKNGILHGATITVNNLFGSSIGNISDYLTTRNITAQQFSLSGGSIDISTLDTGKLVVNQGASIKFSGGGTRYRAGNVTTTALVAGNKIYDISSAPEALHYTGIQNISRYMNGYVEGADAGSLTLAAGKIVLDGTIRGAATAGVYQTHTLELLDKMGYQNTLGVQAPAGGSLFIGVQPTGATENQDSVVNSLVLQQTVAPLYKLDDQTTYLSTQKLSTAGLTNLEIAANTSITVTPNAVISLNPGIVKLSAGSYSKTPYLYLAARWIDVWGKINIPSGSIKLTAEDNFTSYPLDVSGNVNPGYIPLSQEGITLEQGGQIVAAGQSINNSRAATGTGGTATLSYITGGSVLIDDLTYDSSQFNGGGEFTPYAHGVTLSTGSIIDVSGGYGISQQGVVTGGNAGSLNIEGEGIVLNGNLRGYSIQGNNGGSITLQAQNITVAPFAPSNQNPDNTLVLGRNQLEDTGFTQIGLLSANDITVESGASLSPSLVKLTTPVAGEHKKHSTLTTVTSNLIGQSSLSFTAGSLINTVDPYGETIIASPTATVSVLAGAEVSVAPQGTINMKAPKVDLYGSLTALAGTINITAGNAVTVGDLILEEGSKIDASGYNQPSLKPVMPGNHRSYTAFSGGSVTLSSTGSVTTATNSLVDVSGSSPVKTYLLNGKGVPIAEPVASNAGSVTISGLTLNLQGNLRAAHQPNLEGGTLSIISLDTQHSYTLNGSDFQDYLAAGFDALSFKSNHELVFQGFSGSQNSSNTVGLSLTLDAPAFSGTGDTYLWAPYIVLKDSYAYGNTSNVPQTSSGNQLTLAGGWIDANGVFCFTGFQDVKLSATRDITLSDWSYSGTSLGQMLTSSANLTLQADRIYPTTSSDFTISTGSGSISTSSGTITIQAGGSPHNSSPVYSAGGNLTIEAQNIDMEGGYLAAPMGKISLVADQTTGYVHLSGTSTITTAGAIPVNYGSYSSGSLAAPASSVTISGGNVTADSGSTINVSGGGSVLNYQFQPGIEGTLDPFSIEGTNNGKTLWTNRFVIVPGADYSPPASAAEQAGLQVGEAVYLQGIRGLKAGTYTILPEQYAFLPGAMVVTDTGAKVTPGTQTVSADGFPIVAGYMTFMGTSIRPSLMDAFEVQPASYLLANAHVDKNQLVVGNAGQITISGNNTVVAGNMIANAVKGYQGGTISLSGTTAEIEGAAGPQGTASLYVSAGALQGFMEIDIGNISPNNGTVTSTITMDPGAVLSATKVVLSAQNAITLDSGAQINTINSAGTGSASLITPNGLLTMQPNSLVHASDLVTMTIGQLNFQGGLQIDHGTLNLTGQNVYFVPQGSSQTGPSGLYLTSAFWGNFANINNVNISASGGASDGSTQGVVWFPGSSTSAPSNISLSAKDSFTINAAAIEWSNGSDNGSVSITAPTVSLLNRGGGTPAPPSLTNAGSLTLNAGQIYLGEGPLLGGSTAANSSVNGLLIDGFSTVNFNAQNDITFIGSGSLVTGAGNVKFSSARVTTSYYQDANTAYTAPNFTVTLSNPAGTVSIASNGVTPLTAVTPGGTLAINASDIDVKGVIQMASGSLSLNGTSGVTLENGAQVLDTGYTQTITVNGQNTNVYSPGGSVYLNSTGGAVTIQSGATVNVSGVSEYNSTNLNDLGVNAGSISIYSPSAPVDVAAGTLVGNAGKFYSGNTIVATGMGGSFTLDSADLSNFRTTDGKTGFSALYEMLANGGFNDVLNIRSHNDTLLTVGATDVVTARQFTLTADRGSIDVKGSILTSDSNGAASVQLYAGSNLTLESGSAISATGSQSSANGGEITLSSTGGTIYFQNGASLDVSGGASGQGGNVYFRASVNTAVTDVNSLTNMNLAGSITGARQILAEGFQTYSYTGNTTITSTYISGWQTGIQNFMTSYGSSIQNGLFTNLILNGGSAAPNFVPGLEIDCTGNLTLNSAWNLSTWRYGAKSVPGMLTLRAAGDLVINQNLTDAPTGMTSLLSTTAKPSWGMTLVAGADLSSADPAQFARGTGNLTIANGKVVYSESAPLSLSAGNTLTIGSGATPGYMINGSMRYNIGTYSGSINVNTGNDLTINGGAIESATGDINVNAGGDLNLNFANGFLGAIRTTGESPTAYSTKYWTYGNGGNITIHVSGNVGSVNGSIAIANTSGNINNGWDSNNSSGGWSANYLANATEGLATMAGGNLTVFAGGSFLCQAGTFAGVSSTGVFANNSGGNLTIFSGGDMEGRFLIGGVDHFGELTSMGNFNAGTTNLPIEMFADTVNVTAQGQIDLGAIVNPTISRPTTTPPAGNGGDPTKPWWDLSYASATASGGMYASVNLTSVKGDVTLYGYNDSNPSYYGTYDDSLSILPPTVTITAGGNINLLQSFTLAPYSNGNLTLMARGNISGPAGGSSEIYMSEMSDALSGSNDVVYGFQPGLQQITGGGGGLTGSLGFDAAGILHIGDASPVVVSAGQNVNNLRFYMPKESDITAGGDIDIFYYGQNNSYTSNGGSTYISNDVTIIKAGGNIGFGSWQTAGGGDSGILVSGPGALVVEAGNSIDLGTSAGIQVQANTADPSQSAAASMLIAASGYTGDFYNLQNGSTKADSDFFHSLSTLGTEYSKDLAAGNTAAAKRVVAEVNATIIKPFDKIAGPAASGSGDINMTSSQICAKSNTPGIFIFTNGSVNVGATTIGGQSSNTGIYTGYGGGINIFANGNVNVNESRVMTFFGGDITVWSVAGSINAGKGAKTAVTTSPPSYSCVGGQDSQGNCLGFYVEVFAPPTVGSGVRAVTYSPGLGLAEPSAGNIYMFAPQGVINAGEAGIAGNQVILGAVQVLNASNIIFSAGSVGVPVSSGSVSGLGALTGTGAVTQGLQNQEAAIMSAAAAKLAQGDTTSDAFSTAWLEVRVLSFFEVDASDSGWESTDN